MPPVVITPSDFIPTASLRGIDIPFVFRGKNMVLRGQGESMYLSVFPGCADIGEDYDIAGEMLSGKLAWTAGDKTIIGTGSAFSEELRPGQLILAGTEVFAVNKVTDDTHFISDRAPTTTASGQDGIYLRTLFEIDGKRGSLIRGNAIRIDRGDLLVAGQGALFLNGATVSFTATRRPQRLERSVSGTYTAYPLGFDTPPPVPSIAVVAGGAKAMMDGKYSFLLSYYNSVTKGFSNPSEVVKQTSGAVDLEIDAGTSKTRFEFDLTAPLAVKPANADGFIIWGSPSGGGVADTNASFFNNGQWQEVVRIRTSARTFTDTNVSTANDTLGIDGHDFKTADVVYLTTTGALPTGLAAATAYYAIYVDENTIKLASSIANAKAGTAINITAASGGGTHSAKPIDASNKTFIEYLDSELGAVASGDNDPPPECEFLAEFANVPFFISALGNKRVGKTSGGSPGNYVIPTKNSNREAAPQAWRTSVGDEITGFALGVGRLFCLTRKGIPFVSPTGNTEVARLLPTLADYPFTSRPFWTKGAISPYNIAVVQGDVFAMSGGQPLMSPRGASDDEYRPFELGKKIRDLIEEWRDGYGFVEEDPKNQQVCFFQSATRKNASGYWESDILPFNLQTNTWMPPVVLSSATNDMIVSGAAVVDNRLEFLAGGRTTAGSGFELKTYRYDEQDGISKPFYFATQISDFNIPDRAKKIRRQSVVGRFETLTMTYHGADADNTEISIADLEAGTNSLSGSITFTGGGAELERSRLIRHLTKFDEASMRIGGTWDGTDLPPRIDKVLLEVMEFGKRR